MSIPAHTYYQRPHHLMRSQTDIPRQRPRPKPSSTYPTYRDRPTAGPWQHMAHTYEWVVEQDVVKHDKHNSTTEQWVLEQQIFLTTDAGMQSIRDDGSGRGVWEEMMYAYEIEAEGWMRHEESVRRMAAEREREKARLVQEEMRRIEARIRRRREVERKRIAEEKLKAYAEFQEREKRQRSMAKGDKALIDAWNHYESRWSALATSTDPLTFSDIPWPLMSPPLNVAEITPERIVLFLFSPAHSQSQSRKDRIRSAQLRWHPDRFRRLMGRVREEDKSAIEEGVGIVARCLNDSMARETGGCKHAR
ncbi:hypothetical protein BD779DRAFT_1669370 [Infundibulicybe gibba]|nr:hypothetical protein BD779DRAFT_1669370 [Infundibulicybe gibba]